MTDSMRNYENYITRRQIVRALGGLTIVGAAVAGQAATADEESGDSSNDSNDEVAPCVGDDLDNCPT